MRLWLVVLSFVQIIFISSSIQGECQVDLAKVLVSPRYFDKMHRGFPAEVTRHVDGFIGITKAARAKIFHSRSSFSIFIVMDVATTSNRFNRLSDAQIRARLLQINPRLQYIADRDLIFGTTFSIVEIRGRARDFRSLFLTPYARSRFVWVGLTHRGSANFGSRLANLQTAATFANSESWE